MGSRRKKGGKKGVDPENVIEAAFVNGLSDEVTSGLASA